MVGALWLVAVGCGWMMVLHRLQTFGSLKRNHGEGGWEAALRDKETRKGGELRGGQEEGWSGEPAQGGGGGEPQRSAQSSTRTHRREPKILQ